MIALYIAAWFLVGIALDIWELYDKAKHGETVIPTDAKWFYPAVFFFGPVFLLLIIIIGPFMWYKESEVKNPFGKYCQRKREGEVK